MPNFSSLAGLEVAEKFVVGWGVDLFNTGQIKSGKFLPLKVLPLKIAVKFLSVTSLPKNNQANLDRFSFGIKIVNFI